MQALTLTPQDRAISQTRRCRRCCHRCCWSCGKPARPGKRPCKGGRKRMSNMRQDCRGGDEGGFWGSSISCWPYDVMPRQPHYCCYGH